MVQVVELKAEGSAWVQREFQTSTFEAILGQFLVVAGVQSELHDWRFEAILGPVSSRGWGPK